jgi:hypothetical protein
MARIHASQTADFAASPLTSRRAVAIGAIVLVSLVVCASQAHGAAPKPRPPDGGTYGFEVPEAPPYASERAVVHYTTRSRDRPPRRDSDRDGVPDYVEIAGAAADDALQSFNVLGLRAPVADSAGGDPRPDIYIRALGPSFGRAVPPADAVGGAFVLIAPSLDLVSTATSKAKAGLRQQVAHELGHLVQFAYVPGGMPQWIAEGTANLLAMLSLSRGPFEPPDVNSMAFFLKFTAHRERSLYDVEYDNPYCSRFSGEQRPSLCRKRNPLHQLATALARAAFQRRSAP